MPITLKKDWKCLENDDMLTFVEAKKLVIYPMLIAQFIGIVHELKPIFLSQLPSNDFVAAGHFPPSLASLGRFSGNSKAILNKFSERNIAIRVLENFDVRLSHVRKYTERSAFDIENYGTEIAPPNNAGVESVDETDYVRLHSIDIPF